MESHPRTGRIPLRRKRERQASQRAAEADTLGRPCAEGSSRPADFGSQAIGLEICPTAITRSFSRNTLSQTIDSCESAFPRRFGGGWNWTIANRRLSEGDDFTGSLGNPNCTTSTPPSATFDWPGFNFRRQGHERASSPTSLAKRGSESRRRRKARMAANDESRVSLVSHRRRGRPVGN